MAALQGIVTQDPRQAATHMSIGQVQERGGLIDDAIAIRPMCHLSLGYDHRLIDGADAGRFLSFMKERLENFEEGWM